MGGERDLISNKLLPAHNLKFLSLIRCEPFRMGTTAVIFFLIYQNSLVDHLLDHDDKNQTIVFLYIDRSR